MSSSKAGCKIQSWKLLISFTAGEPKSLAQVLFVFFNRLLSCATCKQIREEQDFKLGSSASGDEPNFSPGHRDPCHDRGGFPGGFRMGLPCEVCSYS